MVQLKNIAAGLGILVVFLLAITGCAGDSCRLESFLGIPWALWGLLFYAAILLLPLKYVPYLAGAGLAVHIYLVSLMAVTDSWCNGCILAAFITAMLLFISIRYFRFPVLLYLLISIGIGTVFISVPSANMATSEVTVKQTAIPVSHKTITTPLDYDKRTADLITAYNADGEEIKLNLSEKPVLFFSYWCDHCTEVLETVAKLPIEQQPYLVNIYVFDNNYKDLVADKVRAAGLKNIAYYSDFEPESVPMLVYRKDGQRKLLRGGYEIEKHFNSPAGKSPS